MRIFDGKGLSQLEREYELQMAADVPEGATEPAEEYEWLEDGAELEADGDLDHGGGLGGGAEFETLRDDVGGEFEAGDIDSSGYARRFYELAQHEFESERELESAIGQVIDDMEREYFFGGLMKKVSAAGRKLLKKGVHLAKHHPAFQAVKGITQMARGNLKGMLGNMAKVAIAGAASAFPGASLALPALGLQVPGGGIPNLGDLSKLVSVSREAFDHLARELDERSDQPVEAARVAAAAFQKAVSGAPSIGPRQANGGPGRRRIKVRRGDILVIEIV